MPDGKTTLADLLARRGEVDRGRAGTAKAERLEDLRQPHRDPSRTDRRQVRDLARQAGMAAADLTVADDRGAYALTEEHIDEVASAVLGARHPVDVVVDRHGTVHQLGQHGRRVERAHQERRVRELDEPPGHTVHRIGGADDRETERTGAAAGDLA